MRFFASILLCAVLVATGTAARAERVFNQAELDALLAPIALYPDQVLSNILVAASYPDEVREAANWTRDNPQLKGEDALRAIQPAPWQPSVKALVPFPEVLARMDENQQWLQDLGEAYRVHGPYVMDTVQGLRRRAQSSGYLRSDSQQQVYNEGGAIVVAPASPEMVYVPYYDPYVVYGGWWWPAYRPVVWAPWPVYGAFISVGFVATRFDWGHRRVVVVDRPVFVNRPGQMHAPFRGQAVANHPSPTGMHAPFRAASEPRRFNGPPAPSVRMQQGGMPAPSVRMQQGAAPAPSVRMQQQAARDQRMPPAQGFFHRFPDAQRAQAAPRTPVAQGHGSSQGRGGFQNRQSQGHWGGQHGGRRG